MAATSIPGLPARRSRGHPRRARRSRPGRVPNEACGLVAGTTPAAEGGAPTRWHPTRNRAASPLRYEIHPDDLLRVSLAIDDADEVTWGIVHSHVRSAARPSSTDVGLALYPDALYLLVSLAADQADPVTGAASVRAWRIVDGAIFEVALDVDEARPG